MEVNINYSAIFCRKIMGPNRDIGSGHFLHGSSPPEKNFG